MNKTKLVWRLANRPTPSEVMDLKDRGIIDKEEAREILFSLETEEDRDKKSLESEIKFLREIVEKLSSDKTRIVEVIKEVHKPYYQQPWYTPYYTWCSSGTGGTTITSGSNTLYYTTDSLSGAVNAITTSTGDASFSDIKTF